MPLSGISYSIITVSFLMSSKRLIVTFVSCFPAAASFGRELPIAAPASLPITPKANIRPESRLTVIIDDFLHLVRPIIRSLHHRVFRKSKSSRSLILSPHVSIGIVILLILHFFLIYFFSRPSAVPFVSSFRILRCTTIKAQFCSVREKDSGRDPPCRC